MRKSERLGLVLTPKEKAAVIRLAEVEGGLSQGAVIRRLIRKAAKAIGVWSKDTTGSEHEQQKARAA